MPPVLPVVFLFGPTGVGKTDLIENLSGSAYEIVSADSMQVYIGMDIGTAKPELSLRKKIQHHLIDICTPDIQFHLGEFLRRADKACFEILGRGKIPVISGGTAYYFKHFLFGLPNAPESDPEIRDALQEELNSRGSQVLLNELSSVDPVSYERIAPSDHYRIMRALEVYRVSGKPLSSFSVPEVLRDGLKPLIIGLQRPREELYRRINERVDSMFRSGLVDEITRLTSQGYTSIDPGMKAIGYKEFFQSENGSGEFDLSLVKQEIQKNSRRYAKRQITFFKAIPETMWISPEKQEDIMKLIENFREENRL